jgi:two-component system nitrate/nitrite response regulator NarL
MQRAFETQIRPDRQPAAANGYPLMKADPPEHARSFPTGSAPLSRERRPAPATPAAAPTATSSSGKGPIRVLLADDHPVVRKGLTVCLEHSENLVVIGEAANGREAVRKARELAPDVVLMDIDMPQMNGLTATEALSREQPGIKILILSIHADSELIVRILKSGARGCILKEASPEEVVRAIETVHAGQTFFSPEAARVALNQMVRGGSEGPQVSNRECEVLAAIAEGLSNKEIACRLNVSVRTIETHRERLMRKLDIHSVAGLTKYAIRKGLVSLPPGQT